MADSDEDAVASLSDSFRRHLNTHGYGFQYAVLKHIRNMPRTRWEVEAVELPVSFRGRATHIDFVLRNCWAEPLLRVAAECKRANPALVDWGFVRTPDMSDAAVLTLEVVRFQSGGLKTAGLESHNFWHSDRVYNLGFPIKGCEKGDSAGSSRTALDDAIAQVLRGANGLMEYLAGNPKLLRGHGPDDRSGRVLPVVFTTARLWASDIELSESDLASGNVPEGSLKKLEWLWLKQNISTDLRHSLSPASRPDVPDPSLEDYIRRDYVRVIAIVSMAGIDSFLEDIRAR